MPTPLLFSTTWPERMGDKAGERNYFPEKIWAGLNIPLYEDICKSFGIDPRGVVFQQPKTQTIRKNYEYWKKKEGKYVQPAIWSGKPRHSKMIYFCPPVMLKEVRTIKISPKKGYVEHKYYKCGLKPINRDTIHSEYTRDAFKYFAQSDGFDNTDDFFKWFDQDFQGGLLRFGV